VQPPHGARSRPRLFPEAIACANCLILRPSQQVAKEAGERKSFGEIPKKALRTRNVPAGCQSYPKG